MRLDGHQRGTTDILIHHQRYHERYHADGVLDGSIVPPILDWHSTTRAILLLYARI